MKQLFFISMMFFLIPAAISPALDEIIKAFKTGDIPAIVAFLDNSVELNIGGQNTTYSKQQATKVLTEFFKENKILDFKVLHQSGNNETAFCIGNLSTSSGTYRLTFFAKEKNGKTVLQEIRFEK